MEGSDEAIRQAKESIGEFDVYLRRRILASYPELTPILREIRALAETVDLDHLSQVPVQTLTEFVTLVKNANSCIKDYMVNSFPIEDQVPRGGGQVRSEALIHNRTNVQAWRGKLTSIHHQLFNLVSPIVAQQQNRLSRIATGVLFGIDFSRSIPIERSGDDRIIWRYMPLRNLLRSEAASGLWMSSLRTLRAWSDGRIVDTREGEIPPVVARLKEEYDGAVKAGPEAIEQFRKTKGFSEADLQRLPQILASLSLESDSAFVSSWLQKSSEGAHMWTLYGDSGKGVALKARLSTLLNYKWRAPVELAGVVGANRLTSLVVRNVKYLTFTEDDELPPLDDLHLPFLKPDEFEAEREFRLVGFTSRPMPRAGFTLLGNLADIIDEIVVGPNADLEYTTSQIKLHAADLSNVPVRKSTLQG
jgi:hypothetical protein